MARFSPLLLALLGCVIIVVLAACADYDNGGQPAAGETVQVFKVNLSDGTTMDCISSDSYGDFGILDCDWTSRKK